MATTIFTPSMLRGAGTRGVPGIPLFTNTYSMNFDGVDEDVSFALANAGPLYDIGTGDFAASVWANATTKTDYATLLGNWNVNGLWMYKQNSGGSHYFKCYVGVDAFTTTFVIPFDDTWHHYLITRSGTDVILYVDGASVLTGTSSATLASNSVSYIGNQPHNSRRWAGNIDEVSIFNVNKNSSEVTAIYNSGTPTDLSGETGLVGWWRMGDGATFSTNWTIPDDSTNSNTGTSNNMEEADRKESIPS